MLNFTVRYNFKEVQDQMSIFQAAILAIHSWPKNISNFFHKSVKILSQRQAVIKAVKFVFELALKRPKKYKQNPPPLPSV